MKDAVAWIVAGAWVLGVMTSGCADGRDEVALVHAGEVELIGIWGRRLDDRRAYRVPLDSARAVALGRCTREALAVVNRTAQVVALEALVLDGDPGAWRLLAPTRALETPLGEVRQTLLPGAQLDLDVAVCPREAGPYEAWIGLSWREGARVRGRWGWLAAEARAAVPSPTGPGPP